MSVSGAIPTVQAMTNTLSHIDTAAVEAFAGRVLTDFAGAASTATTLIGDRLGLYEAMTGAGPTLAGELAERTRLHPRLVTEWLAAQTVSGYLRHDPSADTYELPDEHAMALSVVASPAYVIGAAEVIAGQYATLAQLEGAFRGGGGIDYHAFRTGSRTASSGSSAPPTPTNWRSPGSRPSRVSWNGWTTAPGWPPWAAATGPRP
jgi:hypothetical protein